MKRQPHVVGARLILALVHEDCPPYSAQIAEHLGLRRNTAIKLLTELCGAGVLGRELEAQERTPGRWRYFIIGRNHE